MEEPGDLLDAAPNVIGHDSPAVLDVVTAIQDLTMRPAISLEQTKGIGLWVLRAATSRCRDEVVDLAEQNPRPR